MNHSKLEELIKIVQEINKDEFREPPLYDDKFEHLKSELLFLSKELKSEKTRKASLIEHLTLCISGDFFEMFQVSEKFDEIDVIGIAFNTYIEELEAQIVSKEFFNQVIDFLPHKIIVFSENGEVEMSNGTNSNFPELINNFGLSFENNISQNIAVKVKKVYQGKSLKEKFFYRDLIDEGSVFRCTLEKITYLKKTHFLFVAKDVSEENLEQVKILKATIDGQDQERIRLAKDLHDSLGQELNAIKMYFNALEMVSFNDKKYKQIKREIDSMLTASIKSIQDISFNLMPSVLEKNNLNDAISQLINKVSKVSDIFISFNVIGKEIKFLEKKNELSIYRIVQEFLNNSIKYSNASRVEVTINSNDSLLCFELKDNGDGFDFEIKSFNNGINNIKQRLSILGVEYDFNSISGEGTFLKFNFDEKYLK